MWTSLKGLIPKCCDSQTYDAKFEMCCWGNVKKQRGLMPMCCGINSYDSVFEQCCFGRFVRPQIYGHC